MAQSARAEAAAQRQAQAAVEEQVAEVRHNALVERNQAEEMVAMTRKTVALEAAEVRALLAAQLTQEAEAGAWRDEAQCARDAWSEVEHQKQEGQEACAVKRHRRRRARRWVALDACAGCCHGMNSRGGKRRQPRLCAFAGGAV